jgi:hypothetical protein
MFKRKAPINNVLFCILMFVLLAGMAILFKPADAQVSGETGQRIKTPAQNYFIRFLFFRWQHLKKGQATFLYEKK